MKQDYSDGNYIKDVGHVDICYLCGHQLEDDKKPGHIIPNKLFGLGLSH